MTTNEQKILAQDWPEASQFKKSIRLEFSIYMAVIIMILMVEIHHYLVDFPIGHCMLIYFQDYVELEY